MGKRYMDFEERPVRGGAARGQNYCFKQRRLTEMKHVKSISRGMPRGADTFQDIVCAINTIIYGIDLAKGSQPGIFGFINTKCAIPASGGSNSTTGGGTTV